jgi:hypothetical protein
MKTMLAIAVFACSFGGPDGAEEFGMLKKLEGAWESADKDHPCTVTYRVTSGGSAVAETMTMPNHAEMLTVYHLEGGKLAMTHYCMLGNQPHMTSAGSAKAGTITLSCADAKACADAKHMHALTVTVADADHLEQAWTLFDGGKEQGVHSFKLARKK